VDGDDGYLHANPLIDRVERVGTGASLTLAISKQELELMRNAKSVEVAANFAMVVERASGELGGKFSMAGAPAVIDLALKNCPSSPIEVPVPQLQAMLRQPYPQHHDHEPLPLFLGDTTPPLMNISPGWSRCLSSTSTFADVSGRRPPRRNEYLSRCSPGRINRAGKRFEKLSLP
jgi:hypothetical protein